MAGSTKHIIQSLVANAAIAVAKGVAAVMTGSGAMLAEAIHSGADCSNQALLLLGVKRSQQPPDDKHPLGYGRSLYFWSFIVALLLFSGGGVFSIYEGVHKLSHVEPIESPLVAVGVLVFALIIEGGATLSNIKELNKRRGTTPFATYLRATKDSDLVVVFGENAAATLGLALALLAVGVAMLTGDPRWDAYGTLAIGVVLVGVAVFLAIEIKSLLVGEAADPRIAQAAREVATELKQFTELLSVITVQQGPGEVLFIAKVRLSEKMTSDQVVEAINTFEKTLRGKCPEVKWSYVEPDVEA
jgi:cation diffusion facilitator family transporter